MEKLIVPSLLVVLGLVVLAMSIRVVPEYRRLVVFRLGRCLGAKGPGLVILIPYVDRGVSTDLREAFFDVQPQTCITSDNASVSIDFLVYDQLIDPVRSVLEVENFTGAARGLAITTLRAVVGAMTLDQVLSNRDEINEILHQKLDEVTDRWGVKVTAVEIREVVPPPAIEQAMTRQMAAERDRRAIVTTAEGNREAAIATAEGERQATILRAEGERQATILRAEAERQSAILRAEGQALGLAEVNKVAQQADSRTLTLQYLDALRMLGEGAATKFIIPSELLGLVRPLSEHVSQSLKDGDSLKQP
ncbi:MAG: SPFH domain-containing protein [Anaerolineae bacterium]